MSPIQAAQCRLNLRRSTPLPDREHWEVELSNLHRFFRVCARTSSGRVVFQLGMLEGGSRSCLLLNRVCMLAAKRMHGSHMVPCYFTDIYRLYHQTNDHLEIPTRTKAGAPLSNNQELVASARVCTAFGNAGHMVPEVWNHVIRFEDGVVCRCSKPFSLRAI